MEKESIDGLSDRQAELGDKEDRSEREEGGGTGRQRQGVTCKQRYSET